MTRKQMSMLITQTFAPTGIRTRDPKNVRQPHYRCAIRVVIVTNRLYDKVDFSMTTIERDNLKLL